MWWIMRLGDVVDDEIEIKGAVLGDVVDDEIEIKGDVLGEVVDDEIKGGRG